MKATINQNGALVLQPESAIEGYALKHWMAADKNDVIAHAYVEAPAPAVTGLMRKVAVAKDQTQ